MEETTKTVRFPTQVWDVHVHYGFEKNSQKLVGDAELEAFYNRGFHRKIVAFSGDSHQLINSQKLAKFASRNDWLYVLYRASVEDYMMLETDLGRFFESPKVIGFKIHTSEDRRLISDPVYRYALEEASSRKAIVLVHCGRWVETSGAKHVFEVSKSYPQAVFVCAHMGGNEPDLTRYAVAQLPDFQNVYLDTSNCRLPSLIKQAVESGCGEKILFGSDYPFGSLLANLSIPMESELSDQAFDRIMRHNLEAIIAQIKVVSNR